MKQFFIYYFLMLRGLFFTYYNKVRNHIFNVKKIETSANNQCKSIYMKYIMVYFLTKIIIMLNKLREYFNVKNDTIHIIKLNDEKQKIHYITDSSLVESVVDMSKLNKKSDEFNGTIMTFELRMKDKVHCLKQHLRKYGNKEHNSHTLNNIALYNGFYHNDDTAEISVRLFNSGKIVSKTHKWNKVKDKHIKDLLNN